MAYSEDNTTILNRILGNMSDTVDKTEGYIAYDIPSATSQEFSKVSNELDDLGSKFDISNLHGDELATRVNERTGLTPNAATYSIGTLSISGNTTINIGDLFQTASRVQFSATQQVTINGTGNVPVKAVVPGSVGNIPANQITQMPIRLSGITSVTNPNPTAGGYDKESDASLLQRYYDKLQSPNTGANIAFYISMAKAYAGVGDIKVYPTWNGNDTVKISVIDSNKVPPNSSFITAMQTYVDPLGSSTWGQGYGQAPYGAFTTVEAATAKTINVSFTAVKDTNFTDSQRLTNFTAALTAYLESIAFVSDAVSYNKIGSLIIDTDGFLDYSNLTVNSGTVPINLSYTGSLTECPVVGTITIS